MFSIVTKTGDNGTTGLYGGDRTSKADMRIEAIGTVDELNAMLGCILSREDLPLAISSHLTHVQHQLFTLGADLAAPLPSATKAKRITLQHVTLLEEWIDALEAELPPLTKFILPSGSETGSLLHLARTICRRAERHMVALHAEHPVNVQASVYINRLSDLLFLLARSVNVSLGRPETTVIYE